MTDLDQILDDLQTELEESTQTLGDLLQEAVEDPSNAPDVIVDLLQEAQETGQSLGEIFQDASQDFVDQFGDGDLSLDGDQLFLDFEGDQLPLDPTDDDFLNQLDVFGVGESLGLIPEADEE
jgi:hypothetical protein